MLTFDSLKTYSMANPPMEMLGRAPDVQEKYDTFAAQGQNRGSFISTMKETLQCKPFHFVPNDFPYHTTPNIHHWVCWYGQEVTPDEIVAEIKKRNDISIVTYWKNHSHNMSIQEINHIHIFIQN